MAEDTAGTTTPPPTRLFVALALSAGLAPLNSTMLAVAIPSIGRALSLEASLVTHALVTSYLVVSITLQSPGGKIGDAIGYRRALRIGQWIFLVGAAIGILAPEIVTLVVSRVLMAAGGAVIVPSATALIRTELPPERRGRAFGMFGATMAMSAMVGPLVGGFLESHFGFRALFAANVPVLLASAILAGTVPAVLPTAATKGRARPRFDLAGSGMLATGLTLLVVGSKLSGALRYGAMAAGALVLGPFIWHELRVADPVMDLRLLSIRPLLSGAILTAMHNLGMYALLFMLPGVLDVLFSLDSKGTGRLVIGMMAAMVVVSPFAGRLSDRLGARLLAIVGCCIALGGMIALYFTPLDAPWRIVPPLVAIGAGIGAAASPSQAAAMSAAPREKSGMAAGMLSTVRYAGGVAGILVLALVNRTGEPQSVARASAELHAALAVFIAAFAVGLVAVFMLPNRIATTPR